jgi:small redox-active disulfide protein 2
MEIEILGTGCPNCRVLEARTRDALAAAGRDDATVVKVEEMADIVSYGVMGLPALVVDGEVVLSGRVPETDELASLLDPGA